jgi:general stress protein 26
MDAKQLWTVLQILEKTSDLTIATIREDGYPQATTVSYVSDGLKIYFGTSPASQKARNLARCDKVSVTVNKAYETWDDIQSLSIGGLAHRVTDPAELGKAGQLMLAKFPQVAKYAPPDASGLAIFRVTMQVVSILDYAKGFGHTELVRVEEAVS